MNKHSVDLLLEACGAGGQLQVHVQRQGQGTGAYKKLFLPLAVIGRGDNTDLPLIDPQVSRRHAYVQLIDGRLFGMDLRSRTGTHWDAGGTTGVGWVASNQPIRIGPFVVRCEAPAPEEGSVPPDAANPLLGPPFYPEDEVPTLTLECIKGMQPLPPWQMTSTLALIGRRAHSYGLVIDDQSLASFQCSLLRSRSGTWVIDLLGLGGVVLNKRRVRWGRLDDGDQLQLGRYQFCVRFGEKVGAPRRQEYSAEVAAMGEANRLAQTAPGTNGNRSPAREATDTAVSSGGSLVAINSPYLTRTDLNETLLMPLFNQFAAMQNQMFDQFQQALMMMVEMFSEMQRDQVSLIRQEVDRLHQITEELQSLQNELAKHPVPPGWLPQVSPETAAPTMPAEAEANWDVPSPDTSASDTVMPPLVEAPVAPPNPPPLETGTQTPSAETSEAAAVPPGLKIPQPPLAAVDGEVHVWLYEKIAALQRERQSRLQKIISFLRGK
jgi:pSer/pThr/pTyr-binding forkhead associated (FHA) protein